MKQKECPENRTLPECSDRTQAAAYGRTLASDASQKLRAGDLSGFQAAYDELWKLFLANDKLVCLAQHLGGVLRDLGAYRLERSDYIQLSRCMKYACRLYKRFPDSVSLAENYAFLLSGILNLKSELGDFDDFDEYIAELLALSRRFPDSFEMPRENTYRKDENTIKFFKRTGVDDGAHV